MAAVMLSNPGLPLAVLGNPRRRKHMAKRRRRNPSKRTPRFFLRRFKRNPYYHGTGYSKGGSMWATGTAPRFAKSRSALRDALEAEGISVSNITPVRKSGKSKRRVRRHHKKAHRARRTTMAKTRRRTSAKRRIAALRRHSKVIGRVFRRKVKGRKYAVKILGVRKGHGKRRKVRAVKWSGKKGSKIYRALSYGSRHKKGTHVIGFTNPKRRGKRRARRTYRRNPLPGVIGEYVGGLTTAPRKAMSLFKGPGMIKNVGFTAAGAIGSFMVGGVISHKLIKPLLEKVAPSFAAQVADPTTIQARVVGGLLPYSTAFLVTKLFGKKLGADASSALLLGGAIASIVELIRPGLVGDGLKKLGLGSIPQLAGLGALGGPVCGLGYSDQLAGYYSTQAYHGQSAGVHGIVSVPAYQGSAGIAGYVQDRSQRLSGMGTEVLAGTFLDEAADNALENNWLNTEDAGGAVDTNPDAAQLIQQ
jgi:hypothetical protein